MRKAAALKFGSVPDFMDFEQIDVGSYFYFPKTFLIECGEDDDWSWSIWEYGEETAEDYGFSSAEDAVEDLRLYIEGQKEYLAAAKSKSDYAYTPDDEPSHWKLDISDKEHAAAAKAALGKGYRGNKVEIPEKDRKSVIDKVNIACRK